MNQIQAWQMGVDVCLVMAILVMAFRWMKGSQAQALLPRTVELESSLRALIHEADAAGRHLNEQLLRREQNLQRFIGDIDSGEQRVSRAIAAAEDRSKELGSGSEKAQAILREITSVLAELRSELKQEAAPRRDSQRNAAEAPTSSRAEPRRDVPPPPAFEEIGAELRREVRPERPAREQAPPPRRDLEDRYDDLMERAPARKAAPPTARMQDAQAARQSSAGVRTERSEASRRQAAYEPAEAGQRELQQVYATAEELLKQGKKLEQVAAQTRIPVEEVRLLSQMIEIEREEAVRDANPRQPRAPVDPRLGALGAIRRQTTSL